MASSSRGGSTAPEEPPTQFASTPPPQIPMADYSFTLQAVMDLKGTVSSLATKVDRLIADVGEQGNKIDTVRHQISFVKGAMWVIGGLIGLFVVGIGIYLKVKGG